MQFEGKVWKYGDNIDTDVIIPARYLVTTDPQQLALHCMEDADTMFASKVQPGDIMVGGSNFGCGSSREHAPISIKGAGISCIIAESFARIFFRNAINIGLPILESPEAARDAEKDDVLSVDLVAGIITNMRTGKTYQASPYPPFVLEIINAGGLVPYTRNVLGIEITG
ncbi:MAG: 3-isopropylmalate dehydratase small subunit [Anaerolineae bacterium]|nr:3-isopropylmalate dehydratase small subunit [Anaerolineae bacterium]